MKVARIYLRVSTDDQDIARQAGIEASAAAQGYYIAGVYKEKASGARADRLELQRMIADLRPGDVVIAENMDRITRLPLPEAEALIKRIRDAGARLAVPGLVDLSEVLTSSDGVTKIVLEAMQDMLLRIMLHQARENYETMRRRQREGIELAKADGKYKGGRKGDKTVHERIVAFRTARHSIADTARLAGCSEPLVKLVWREHKAKVAAAAAEAGGLKSKAGAFSRTRKPASTKTGMPLQGSRSRARSLRDWPPRAATPQGHHLPNGETNLNPNPSKAGSWSSCSALMKTS